MFDAVMARFDQADVARLLQNEGIVRHRGKIEAVINNAARAQESWLRRLRIFVVIRFW